MFVSLISLVGHLILWAVEHSPDLAALAFPDERNYYLAASHLIRQQGLSFFLTPRSLWNGPINPLWVWLCQEDAIQVKCFNLGLVAFSGFLLWDSTWRLFSLRAAFIVLVVWSVHPPLTVFGPTLLSEPPFLFLLALSLLLVVRSATVASAHQRLFCAGLGGLAFALATLTRPTLQLFPFLLLLVGGILLLFPQTRPTTRAILGPLVTFAASFFFLIAPYCLKNLIWLDKLGIANGSGAVLYLGNDLRKDGDEPLYSGMQFDTGEITKTYTHLDNEGDRALTHATLAIMRTFPRQIVALTIRKVARFLFGSPRAYFYPQRDGISFFKQHYLGRSAMVFLEIALVIFVSCFGIVGLFCLPLSLPLRLFSGSLAFYLIILHSLMFPIPRLALPLFLVLLPFGAGLITNASYVFLRRSTWAVTTVISFIVILSGCIKKPWVDKDYPSFFPSLITIEAGRPSAILHARLDTSGCFIATDRESPSISFHLPSIDPQSNQVVFITLKANSTGHKRPRNPELRLHWSSSEQFSATSSITTAFAFSPESRTFMFTPALSSEWTKEVSFVRFDLPTKAAGARYCIEKIEIRK